MSKDKQTAVEWFSNQSWKLKIQLENKEISLGEYAVTYVKLVDEAKEVEKEQSQKYAEFCVRCDRENLPLLDFESFIETYGGNKWGHT